MDCGGLVSAGRLQVRALGSLGPQLPIAEVSGWTGVNSGKALGDDPLPHATPRPGLAGGHCDRRRGRRGSKGRNLKPTAVPLPGRARVHGQRDARGRGAAGSNVCAPVEGLGASPPCAQCPRVAPTLAGHDGEQAVDHDQELLLRGVALQDAQQHRDDGAGVRYCGRRVPGQRCVGHRRAGFTPGWRQGSVVVGRMLREGCRAGPHKCLCDQVKDRGAGGPARVDIYHGVDMQSVMWEFNLNSKVQSSSEILPV